MIKVIPPKLQKGNEVRVIAPANSLSMISKEIQGIANQRFEDLGLKLSFGRHVNESDEFVSSSIKSRISDLHEAFVDKSVKAVITVIGGFNSNQLLDYIDWDLIRKNPKIFCGYSDITVLGNAIFAKTGLVTYSGPHYSSFGQKLYFDYTLRYFKECLMSDGQFTPESSDSWSDDRWYLDQNKRELIKNKGYLIINDGEVEGPIIGGNLGTFNLLQGTQYFPELRGSILFLEDDYETKPHTFDRDLQSLIHQPGFMGVKGIVVGRFQKASEITDELLTKIIKTKEALNSLPVVANIDFGHTDPKITFPIGGSVRLKASKGKAELEIIEH